MMNKLVKKFLVCLLCIALIFPHTNYVLANTDFKLQDVSINENSDKEFLNGIKNKDRYIFISEMNNQNKWIIFYRLIYKYFPDVFLQDWIHEKIDNKYVICLGTINYQSFCFILSDEFYRRIESHCYDEYDAFIRQIIENANISEKMSQKEKITCIVKEISKYKYDYDLFVNIIYTEYIPEWKIVRDYGISVCDSDSRILKSCLDILGINCRIVSNKTHAWNQVLVEEEWKAVDITRCRYYNNFETYIYFDDSYYTIINTFE